MNRLLTDFNGMFLVMVMVLLSPLIGIAQVTEADAIKAVQSDRCVTALSPNAPQFLRFIRREELEDQLFALRAKNLAPPTKPAYIFEVSSTGTYITEKNEVIEVTSTGMNNKLVAISKLGDVFPLFGCDEKRTAFQNLMRHSKVSIRSEDDARAFGLLYYKLVEDPELKRIVFHRWEVRHQTEDFFLRRYEEKEAEAKFNSWKESFVKARIPSELAIVATSSGQGFLVTIYYMEFHARQSPRLKKEELNLERTGEFEIRKSTYLL